LLEALTKGGIKVKFGFVTTEATPDMRQRATAAGASFLISKPFTPESFKAALGGHIK
jgi:two-component system chemotaxis response regulator CheY